MVSELTDEATGCGASVEILHSTAIARAITAFSSGDDDGRSVLSRTIARTIAADFRDGLVLAYRAWPALLRIPTEDAVLDALRETVLLANDASLARRENFSVDDFQSVTSLEILTRRELEVFDLLAAGYSNQEIAQKLFISQSTVKVHVHHILEKLNVKSRLQAVIKARALLDGSS